jgi:hypothetical protein
MPNLIQILFFCAALSLPIMAKDAIPCPDCDTLYPETDSAIFCDASGNWGLYRQNARRSGFVAPDNTIKSFQTRDIRRTVRFIEAVTVQQNKGITARQATIAFHYPDSLMKDTAWAYNWKMFWLQKQKRLHGITCFDDPDAGKIILEGQKTLDGTSNLAVNVLLCLLAIVIFGSFCAFVIPRKRNAENPLFLTFGCIFAAATVVIMWIEIDVLVRAILASLPMNFWLGSLDLIIGASLFFLYVVVTWAWSQFKIWFSPRLRFEITGSVRDWAVPLGIFVILQAAFLVGLLTRNWLAMICYFGLVAVPFIVIDFAPALIAWWKAKRYLKKMEQKKPPKPAAPR